MHLNVGRYQFILWWDYAWQFGWRRWANALEPIYGTKSLLLGPLEIRRFRSDGK